MASSPKNSRVGHAPCSMLSKEANEKFFSLLEPRTRALSTGFVSVVLSRPPKHPDWKWYQTGLATLVKDHNRKSYYVQIYNIVDWEKTKEEELSKGKIYQVSLPNFHQMETAKGHAMGLKFSDENEAKTFAQIARAISMTGHFKSEGSTSPITSSDEDTLDQQVDEGQVSNGPMSSDKDSPLTTVTPSPPENEETSEIKPTEKDLSLAPPPPPPISKDPPSSPPLSPPRKDQPSIPPRPPPPANMDGAPQQPMQPKSSMKAISPPTPPPPVNKNGALPPIPPPPKATSIRSPPPTPTNKNFVTSPIQKESPKIKSPPPPPPPTPTSPPSSEATLDKRKAKLSKKITKDMIGTPTNFQHVSHIGFNTEVTLDDKTVQSIMSEPVKRPNAPPPPPPPNRRSSVQFPLSHAPAPKRFPEEGIVISFDENPNEKEQARTTVQEPTSTDTEEPNTQDNRETKQRSETEVSNRAKKLLDTQLIKESEINSPDLIPKESEQLQIIEPITSPTDGIYNDNEPEHNNNEVNASSTGKDNFDADNQNSDNSDQMKDSLKQPNPNQLLANNKDENASSSIVPQSGRELQDGSVSPNTLPTPRLNESFDFATDVIQSLNELDIMLEGESDENEEEQPTHDVGTSQLEFTRSESRESEHPDSTQEKQTNVDIPEDSFTGVPSHDILQNNPTGNNQETSTLLEGQIYSDSNPVQETISNAP